jgi:hypothetical protein
LPKKMIVGNQSWPRHSARRSSTQLSGLCCGLNRSGLVSRDPRIERQAAIKLLPSALAADRQAQVRFRREAMAAAVPDHLYICKILEIGEEGEAVFLVTA